MRLLLCILLVMLAGMCNAAMDRLENEVAFNRSIFRKLNRDFWLKSESWDNAKRIFGWKADAWHIAKSTAAILISIAISLYETTGYLFLDLVILGAAWNASFNLFYHQIFFKHGNP